MSRHQQISFAFLHLNCMNMMIAHRWPAISSLSCLSGKPTSARHHLNMLVGRQADIGPPSAQCVVWPASRHRPAITSMCWLAGKPTSARHHLNVLVGRQADIGPPSPQCVGWAASRHRPAITSMCWLGGKPTSAQHPPSDGAMSKSCPPIVVGFATPFIMLVSSASGQTLYSCFTNSFCQLVQT